jgi:Trp operon repressor
MKHSSAKVAKVLRRAESESELKKLLTDLLTPAELKDVHERIQIVEALLAGESQRSVAAKLGMSISKVSRGSRLIQYGTGALVKLL